MIERTATIASRSGLHARPAAIFARAAAELPVDISIALALSTDPTDDCDATSMLSVMSLGADYGDQVMLRAENVHAADCLDHLVRLLETDFDARERPDSDRADPTDRRADWFNSSNCFIQNVVTR